MIRREFLLMVLVSSLLSSAIVLFFLRWPSPAPVEAGWTPTASPGDRQPLSEDERVNIDLYQRFSRGVVNITSTVIEYNWFFDPIPRQGVGSGVIIDNQGRIVTNFHVIENAKQLEVTLFDETTLDASVVGVDPINDLAVVKIDCPKQGCFPVPLGHSEDLRVGQKVLAIGNPFGLQRTLTTGIISSLGRSLRTDYGFVDDVIQTDAAINPGNSGGPLLNTSGEVIGINTAIFSRSGDSAGIGFAIPVNTLSRILPDLIEHGKVNRPWFGVSGRSIGGRLGEALKAPVKSGFLVETVEPGSSADEAGIRGGNQQAYFGNTRLIVGGDILVSIDGKDIEDATDVLRVLESKRPGDEVNVVFYRGDRRLEKEVKLVGKEGGRRFRF